MGGITFTLDLEDHRPDSSAPIRYPALVERLLDDLDRLGVRGTVFTVGSVAEASPELVAAVAARGHEVALHDWSHRQLDQTDPERLAADCARGKALLEDITQSPVVGYRAATFSLTPGTVWATDVLSEAGFEYSSSVLPARNPLHGFPGAPVGPFRWPSGLLEIPVPLIDVGVTQVPLGGTYLRALPLSVIRRRLRDQPVSSLYCHPYDFDVDEPFWWEPVAGAMAPLLWLGRKGLTAKIASLMTASGPPLRDRLEEARAVATEFDPEPPTDGADAAPAGDQREMVHRLPKAPCVDRITHLAAAAEGRSVVHVGFVDSGYREMQEDAGTWLHAHLATTARSLVGLDLDSEGVELARQAGFDAHAIDCRDHAAVRAAGIEPAELVIAGEVIEHLDAPGPFLAALHDLVAPGGRLILTTPNASGLLNTVAALAGREVNHPDHVVLFSWRTLQTLLSRHGWEVEASATYVPVMKSGARSQRGALALGARAVLAAERLAGRLGAGFVADGLIVSCRARG